MVMMSTEPLFVQLKTFDDLVRFVSSSPSPFLQHITLKNKHVYFIQILAFMRNPIIYFVRQDRQAGGKYVVFNRFRDEVTFSDRLSSDGQTVYIPILELERTNLLTDLPSEE